MMNLRIILLLLPLLAFLGCGDQGEKDLPWDIDKDWIEKGPLKIKVKLKKETLSVLDTQHLILEIQAEKGLDIETPGLLERLEDYRQIPWRSDKRENTETHQFITKYFALQNFESGEQVIPPLEVRTYISSGNEQTQLKLKTPTLNFNLTPVEDLSMVERDLEPILGLVKPKPFPWGLVVLAVVAAILVIFLIIKLTKRYSKEKVIPPPPPIPAHILAWKELEALVERQKEGQLEPEIFVSEISNVLRRYIERRFNIKAPESTTEEFLNQLTKNGGELQAQKEVLARFLEFTDLVKFATKKVEDEDVQQGFDFIKSFIQQTQLEAND